jgi:hypothetical protein
MPQPEIVQGFRRETFHGEEDATQTYVANDFITLDATSGEARELVPASDTLILGLSQVAASGTTGTDAPVEVIFDDTEIGLDVVDYSSESMDPDDVTTLIPGNIYELVGEAGSWGADSQNSGSGLACLIFERVEGDLRDQLAGETLTRGRFRIIEGKLLIHTGQTQPQN